MQSVCGLDYSANLVHGLFSSSDSYIRKKSCFHRTVSDTNTNQKILIIYLNTIFVSSQMYPENLEGTRVIVGCMNMEYVSDTARTRAPYLFELVTCPKREPNPLRHSDGHYYSLIPSRFLVCLHILNTGLRLKFRPTSILAGYINTIGDI